jgi:hypothetical protein
MDEETKKEIEELKNLIFSIHNNLQRQIDEIKEKLRKEEYGL